MKKIVLIWLVLSYTSLGNAQIKLRHSYTYIGNETNNAGLRVVGNYIPSGWRDQVELKYGCIDKEGIEIIPTEYEGITLGENIPYIWARTKYNIHTLYSEDGKQCYIKDKHIKMISPKSFLKNNCVIVYAETTFTKYGVMNRYSEMTVPAIYEQLFWIDEEKGLLAGCWNEKWSVIDYKGNMLYSIPYSSVDSGGEGILIVENTNEKWGAIDVSNNIVIPFMYDLLKDYDGRTMWACKKGKYALIDSKENEIIPYSRYGKKVSRIYGYSGYHDVRSISLKNGKTLYFDDNGNEYSYSKAAKEANLSIRKKEFGGRSEIAVIEWPNFTGLSLKQDYELLVGVKSDSKVEGFTITVNGVTDRGVRVVNSSDYDLTINRTLLLHEGMNVIKVSVKNAAGTTQEEKTIVYRPQGGELPSIEWLDFAATANKKEYKMKLGIKSKSKVEEVNVTVNGALTRGIKPVPADGYDLTVDRALALSEGVNRIVVSVRNGDGISTSEKVITYQGINPTPVFNDKRIAFVVGNSHYSNSEMNLTNPENDARDVAEKLKGLGFEVVLKLDATLETMDKELSSFKDKAKDYDVAMFYYAGHGIQNKGVNYIIPSDIQNLSEENLKRQCVNMEDVLDVMEDSQCKLKIVILDACRNDPVSRKWHRSAGTRGLSIMNAPTGTIISFSTSPGSTALDGTGRNSPYTQAFLNTLDMPNLDVFHFFQKVGASVLDMTKKAQNPWLSVSFTGDFYFNKQ